MAGNLLSDDTLAELRAINQSALPHLALVLEQSSTRGEGGVYETSWVAVRTIECRLSRNTTPRETVVADQVISRAAWIVVVDTAEELTTEQRLVVTGETADLAWARELEIVGVPDRYTNEVMRKVYCNDLPPTPPATP